jgi:hypothetical protein
MEVDAIVEIEGAKRIRVASFDVGVVNLAYAVVDFVFYEGEDDADTWEFDVIKIIKTRIGNVKETVHVLSRRLLEVLHDDEDLKTADYCFIERQVSRSIKNTVLSFTISSYFEIKSFDRNLTVQFIAPLAKFEAVKKAFVDNKEIFKTIDFDRHGRELKKLTVEIAKCIFEEYALTEYSDMIRTEKKKDDIADSILQAFALFLDKAPRKNGNPFRLRRRR